MTIRNDSHDFTGTETGIYVMSVAAKLCGMHPQTLRKYERAGLLTPRRNSHYRLYSNRDIARLRAIKDLVDEMGLNIAGVDLTLRVQEKLARFAQSIEAMELETEQKSQLHQEIRAILELMRF